MSKKMIGLFTMFMFATMMIFAQDNTKTEEFEVKGNCDMCQERIEKAAKSVEGVSKADWDKDTKVLVVVFDENTATQEDIEVAIAEAGHDTPNHKATDEVYNELPDCCKYREDGKLKEEDKETKEVEVE